MPAIKRRRRCGHQIRRHDPILQGINRIGEIPGLRLCAVTRGGLFLFFNLQRALVQFIAPGAGNLYGQLHGLFQRQLF